jgi:hypothetical protein
MAILTSSNTDMQTLIEEKKKIRSFLLNLFGLWNGQLQRQQNGNFSRQRQWKLCLYHNIQKPIVS